LSSLGAPQVKLKGGVSVVTYDALFTYTLVIVTIITAVISICNNKKK